jgi:hypothetical protein
MTRAKGTHARVTSVTVLVGLFLTLAVPSRQGGAQVPPAETLAFTAVADAYVQRSSANVHGPAVQTARLRLEARRPSDAGGMSRVISDGTRDAATLTYIYANRPAVGGPDLETCRAVAGGVLVEFNLDGPIPDDGAHSIAIGSPSSDAMSHVTTAGSPQAAEFVLTLATDPPRINAASGHRRTATTERSSAQRTAEVTGAECTRYADS